MDDVFMKIKPIVADFVKDLQASAASKTTATISSTKSLGHKQRTHLAMSPPA